MEKIRSLNAVLFVDISGYTAMMQQDEALAQKHIENFRLALSTLVPESKGRIISFMGDGCLSVFASSVNATECAFKLQQRFIGHDKIPVRIGIHSGDVYFENDSVFGDSVNLASRIESIGIPGSILFSERIYHDIQNHHTLQAKYIGEVPFKNVSGRTKIFALNNKGLSIPTARLLRRKTVNSKSRKSRIWMSYSVLIALMMAVLLFALLRKMMFNEDSITTADKSLTVAVMGFENKTGEKDLDILSEISSDRIINAISQLQIARVISRKTIEEYQEVALASATPLDQFASLKRNFEVNRIIEGQIYRLGQDLLMECSITDPDTEEILVSTPTVRFDEVDPMKGVEEMRQHILSALIVDQDRKQNLLLETKPPKYEAYKKLLAAKEVEANEDMLVLLNEAIELDSGYFEPKLLRISCYYNLGLFKTADSLTNLLEREFIDAVPRQKNLLNFYKALMAGQNNLIYHHFNEELKLAPFDLMSNNTTMVLATEFVYDIKKAFAVYDVIDEDMLDYSNCDQCRTRLYIKMYMDLENGDPANALRLGKIAADTGDKLLVERLRIRAWVQSENWDELDRYIKDQQLLGGTDEGSLALYAAKECALAEQPTQFESYRNIALEAITEMATFYRQGEISFMSQDYNGAIRYFEQVMAEDQTDVQTLCMLAASHLTAGNNSEGESMLERADQMRKLYQYGSVDYYLSTAFSMLGQKSKALEHLRLAVVQGYRIGYYEFHNDYWLIPLRDDPKFAEILTYWIN